MMPVAMRKLELIVLNRDMDSVLARLGESAVFQIAPPDADSEERIAPVSAGKAGAFPEVAGADNLPVLPGNDEEGKSDGLEFLQALERTGKALGFEVPLKVARGVKLPGEQEEALVREFDARTEALVSEIARTKGRIAELRGALDEARAFSGLNLPFADLDRLSFLSVRIGRVDPDETEKLGETLGDRGFILPLDDAGQIIAASSRKGRFALDTDLERAGFRAKEFPADFAGIPAELPVALDKEIEGREKRRKELEAALAGLAAEIRPAWTILHSAFTVKTIIQKTKTGIESLDFAYRLYGWVPRDRVKELVASLAAVTEGRIAVRSFVPEELESVRSGKESVPVLLRHGKYVGSFERLVLSYGAPLYGTIDPTPIVSFFFVLLFSVMFGDIGQGAVIFLTGLYLGRTKKPGLAKYATFAPIFMATGTGSMIMGLLDGSIFANEQLLVPLNRLITGGLTGKPVDRLVQIMPEGGMGKLFMFFGFTLLIGFAINSVGLIVNMVNKFKLGKPEEALCGKTGLSGALFFWWAAVLGIRVAAGGSVSWIDIPGLGLPALALFFSSSLEKIIEGMHRGHKREKDDDGLIGHAVQGLVELIETFSYYLSNTMSFLRVGAFALSHAVLSFVVFTMGELLRTRAPAGILWEVLVFIIGNAVIIVLEGLIVTIQVVRLQYYEFFSKFFTDTGKEFLPFGFGKTRSGT